MIKFRELRADEIDCRVSTVSEKGCSLLLYKDARCDMNILDEIVKPENWQRKHELINGNLFCSVGINVAKAEEEPRWVWKQDVGVESNAEKEKGQASDAFKRACFNWGIGRELYTAPFIWIPAECVTLKDKVDKGQTKKTTFDRFRVTQILYEDSRIVALAIKNDSLKKMAYQIDMRAK